MTKAKTKKTKRTKTEGFRCRRLSDLKKILRNRYRHTVPDDDAGREDLALLLGPISKGRNAEHRMKCQIEIWAPWRSAEEAEALIASVKADPKGFYMTKWDLGNKLGLMDQERETLHIRTIEAIDVTDEERRERRRAKRRVSQQNRRRAAGRQSRATFLETCRLRRQQHQPPWKAKGVSRATYYRRKKATPEGVATNETSLSPAAE